MDVKTYLQQQIANVHDGIHTVLNGLTDEQFNWIPSGTINPISAILIHMLSGEDFFIQTVFQGKPLYWEAQDWGRKIGIQALPTPGSDWDVFKRVKIPVASVLSYEQVIRAAADSYLAGLTAEELDRQVDFFGNMVPVSEILMSHIIVHIANHTGEIAAVKGMQGIKGLPF